MSGTLNGRILHRWMIRRDYRDIGPVEAEMPEHLRWTEEDYLRALRERSTIGFVAEHDDRPIGWVIYELNPDFLEVVRIVVAPEFRRRGVATQMVTRLKGKLSPERRTMLWVRVREDDLPLQLFMRRQGFLATEIHRHWYDDGATSYLMEYRL